MRINGRQEIAMWVLAMLWAAIAMLDWLGSTAGSGWVAFEILSAFFILAFLIVFSLRDRKKPD